MAETIEQFVQKIQNEGVQAGRQQADKIVRDAHEQAKQILAEAQRQQEKILADAKQEAQGLQQRSATELKLAARDTILALRKTLTRAVELLLSKAAEKALRDEQFLAQTLRELIALYAQSDLKAAAGLEINVPADLKDRLGQAVLGELSRGTRGGEATVDLVGLLKRAGFEYSFAGGTVEITRDSVVEQLRGLVTPHLREVLDQAAEQSEG